MTPMAIPALAPGERPWEDEEAGGTLLSPPVIDGEVVAISVDITVWPPVVNVTVAGAGVMI
jgi:hypothetical protein